jgi:hypothetical protein
LRVACLMPPAVASRQAHLQFTGCGWCRGAHTRWRFGLVLALPPPARQQRSAGAAGAVAHTLAGASGLYWRCHRRPTSSARLVRLVPWRTHSLALRACIGVAAAGPPAALSWCAGAVAHTLAGASGLCWRCRRRPGSSAQLVRLVLWRTHSLALRACIGVAAAGPPAAHMRRRGSQRYTATTTSRTAHGGRAAVRWQGFGSWAGPLEIWLRPIERAGPLFVLSKTAPAARRRCRGGVVCNGRRVKKPCRLGNASG